MRIKRTLTGRYRGKKYYTHRLVHAVREGDRIREIILVALGAHYSEPKENWYLICQRIEELVQPDQQGEFAYHARDPEIEEPAQALAQRILQSKKPEVRLALGKLRRRVS